MTENKDLPAFPITPYKEFLDITRGIQMGLSKRELFAGFAMQGLLANNWSGYSKKEEECEVLARCAVNFAEALLSELNKAKP